MIAKMLFFKVELKPTIGERDFERRDMIRIEQRLFPSYTYTKIPFCFVQVNHITQGYRRVQVSMR